MSPGLFQDFMDGYKKRRYKTLPVSTWTQCSGYDCGFPIKTSPDLILSVANFRFPFYEISVQNQCEHKILRSQLRTPTLSEFSYRQDGILIYFLILIVNFVWKANEGHCFVDICSLVEWQGEAERLIQVQLKLYPFPGGILAAAINMTHSSMLYRLDISTFSLFPSLLFQICVPWKIIKSQAFPCLL